ncbi:MAG: hypothetical protein ACRENJ_01110 [Candidatus Eiseniibacteriota bacterium]
MISFAPEFEGELSFESLPDDFVTRIRARVDAGLLSPGTRARADYRVRAADRDGIAFGAEGWLTAYNVGLNEVTVRRVGRNQLQYQVTFWRWTRYAVVHGLVLAAVFLIGYLTWPQLRRDVAAYPHGLWLAGVMMGFFSLAWPWVMTALHRRPAEQALRRILTEAIGGTKARAA